MLYLQSIGGGGKSQVDLVKIKLREETLKEISRAQIFISKKNYYYFTSLPWDFFFVFFLNTAKQKLEAIIFF